MVFLTSIIIVSILYFMQASGLIFVTVVALVAEFMNITMTHALTKSVEKKVTEKFMKVIDKYKAKVMQMKKRTVILEGQREDDTNALFEAREKNKTYEIQIKEYETLKAKLQVTIKNQKAVIKNLTDLPGGSDADDEPT
ncbi:MAG: hypothetical protein K8R67_14045 [Desulfobacteraceae bacterium]|nr:hypothetical protein [Desulfobacteraceae bacterium]